MSAVSVFFDPNAGDVIVFAPPGVAGASRTLAVILRDRAGERLGAVIPQDSHSAAAVMKRKDWSEPFDVEVVELRRPGASPVASVAFDPALTLEAGLDSSRPSQIGVLALGPLLTVRNGASSVAGVHVAPRMVDAPAGCDAAALGRFLRTRLTRTTAARAFSPAVIYAAATSRDGRTCGPMTAVWPPSHAIQGGCEAALVWRAAASKANEGARSVSAIAEKLEAAPRPAAVFRFRLQDDAGADAIKVFHISSSAVAMAARLRDYRRSRDRAWSFLARRIDSYRSGAAYGRSRRVWRELPMAASNASGGLMLDARAHDVQLGDVFLVWADPSAVTLAETSPTPDDATSHDAGGPKWFLAAGEHLIALSAGHPVASRLSSAPFLSAVFRSAQNAKGVKRLRMARMTVRLAARFAKAQDAATRWAFGRFGERGSLASRAALFVEARRAFAVRPNGAGSSSRVLPAHPELHDASPEVFAAGCLWGGLGAAEASHAVALAETTPLAVSLLWPKGDQPAHAGRWVESKPALDQARIVRKYLDIHASAHGEDEARALTESLKAMIEQRATASAPAAQARFD